jgi:hypothetical protein
LQVRGTPASGKSSLAVLLAHHIKQQEPAANVIFIANWDLKAVDAAGNWQSHLVDKYGWVTGERTFFIFDDAQTTYGDIDLWNQLFKSIHDFDNRFAIAFASYGSPTYRLTIHGTPFFVSDVNRVTMRHTDYDELGSVGLLFSQTEFNELVDKKFPIVHHFDSLFLKDVFELSGGHVGAIRDLLKVIVNHSVCFFMMFDRIT